MPTTTTTQEHGERMMTVGELADRLNMKASWIYTQAASGDLPCVKLGKYLRFRPDAIEDWITARTLDAWLEANRVTPRDSR